MKNGVGVHTYNSHTEEKPPSINYYSILTEDDEVVKANYTPRLSAEANTAVRLRTKSCLTCSLLHVTHLGCYTGRDIDDYYQEEGQGQSEEKG